MKSVTRVQILDKDVCVSLRTNAGNGMNQFVPPPIDEYMFSPSGDGQTRFFNLAKVNSLGKKKSVNSKRLYSA